jgi:hypothetical protein
MIKKFNAKMYDKKIYNLNDDFVTETDSDDPLNTLNEVRFNKCGKWTGLIIKIKKLVS